MCNRGALGAVLLIGLLVGPSTAALRVEGVGIKAGATYSSPDFQFEGAEILEPSAVYAPSLAAALVVSTSRRARFHLMTEIGWTRKGYSFSDTDYRVDILSFPLLLRSNVSRDDSGLHIFFGPVLDVVVGRDDDLILDAYRSWAIGGQAGMGSEFRLSRRTNLLLEFKFSSEFTDMLERDLTIDVEGDEVGAETLGSIRHRTLQLSAGLRF